MTEKSWPSRFGTLGEKIFGDEDPFPNAGNSRALENYSSDEMPPTRNPLNPKEIFTSKSKLRAVYKAHGVEEVGTAYENGYDPGKGREEKFERYVEGLGAKLKDRFYGR